MKRILLFLSLLLLVSCEPLLSPPLETPQNFELYKPSQTATALPITPTVEETVVIPTATLQAINTPLPTNAPVPGATEDIDPAAVITIPGGSFWMGCSPDTSELAICPSSAQPAHEVTLNEFTIGVYEVSNAQYQVCVAAGSCSQPRVLSSKTRPDYYINPAYANFPVVNVTHQDAEDYCSFMGGRLPTEAEWEYAARGPEGNLYPWGNQSPDCSFANSFNNANGTACVGDTTAIGSYPNGRSDFGLMDMAGNVWEWVGDYYSPSYYESSPPENPTGPDLGMEYVVRGGGWSGSWLYLQTTTRAYDLNYYRGADLGFRCVFQNESDNPSD